MYFLVNIAKVLRTVFYKTLGCFCNANMQKLRESNFQRKYSLKTSYLLDTFCCTASDIFHVLLKRQGLTFLQLLGASFGVIQSMTGETLRSMSSKISLLLKWQFHWTELELQFRLQSKNPSVAGIVSLLCRLLSVLKLASICR